MQLGEVKKILSEYPNTIVRFLLPDGTYVPPHAHVTEAARIDKRFLDCGGTFREASYCRIQTWVADDLEHRLSAKKLLKILEKAHSILLTDELELDVEHEVNFISQFPLEDIQASDKDLIFKLTRRHTACLAPQICCPPQEEVIKIVRA